MFFLLCLLDFYLGGKVAVVSGFVLIIIIIDFPAWLLFLTYLVRNFGKKIEILDDEIVVKTKGTITYNSLINIENVIVFKSKSDIVRHPSMNYFYIKVEFSDTAIEPVYVTCLMSRDIGEVLKRLKFSGLEQYKYGIALLK